MKIPVRRRGYGLRFDLTPLNDIVFLLIIFLVASPHFTSQEESADTVDLAKLSMRDGDASESDRRIEVTVHSNDEIRMSNKIISQETYRQRIHAAGEKMRDQNQTLEIRFRIDAGATFKIVEPLLIECAKAKITDIKFAVLPE
jgi:biopolymer transport protein ExbD